MAYFDNAATTYPKPECVYEQMDKFYRVSGANAGRGSYRLAQSAGALIGETRELIQELLHCPAKQVVFEPTATIALNIIIQGVIQRGATNIYISPFEHNAVTRTLHHFEEEGRIKIQQLSVSDSMQYDLERIRYQFDALKPDFVIVSHASNVFGLVAPVEEIFSLAKKYGSITLVDMAQTAGLVDLNVGLSKIDFAVFAGHQTLYGPTGIAGLNAALKWGLDKTIDAIWKKEQGHRATLIDLLEQYSYLRIIGNKPGCTYVGIVSAVIDGISSDSAGPIFDRCNIAVRTGLQCAPLAHKFVGTYPAGTIRFRVNYFTSEDDFKELKEALDYIESEL